LPFAFRSFTARSIVVYVEIEVESSKLPSTYLNGRTKRNRAPQKVRPRPMKARTCELLVMEKASDNMPGIRNIMLILIGWTCTACLSFKFSSSCCCCWVVSTWICVVASSIGLSSSAF